MIVGLQMEEDIGKWRMQNANRIHKDAFPSAEKRVHSLCARADCSKVFAQTVLGVSRCSVEYAWILLGSNIDRKGYSLLKPQNMAGVKRKFEISTETGGASTDGGKNQFTAASILKSAYESSVNELKTPDFRIADLDELHYFQQRKRTEYENALRRNRFNYGQWMRYAQFEIDQKDLQRARSIFERALEVDYKNVSMWVRYIQTEIKNKNINHARNLLERATKLLPRIDKLWYMYVTIEESIGNILAVNEIFQNWLQWKPIRDVWIHYLEFKERYEEYEEERLIYERYVTAFCDSDSWLKWVEFEKKHGDYINVENVFKLGINAIFVNKKLSSKFLIEWIRFEHSHKKFDKVRELYAFGFKALTDSQERIRLQKFQTDFEKQYGTDSEDLEKYVLLKRKVMYEEKLSQSPTDYETWWLYLNLIIDSNLSIPISDIRNKFATSISTPPTSFELNHWIPFCYLVYRYSLWEEYENKEIGYAKDIYEKLAKLIPHKKICVPDFWFRYAEFELRNFDLSAMRKILGQAIGLTSNIDIIVYYIKLETKLKYFDRARKLYNKLIELYPEYWTNWLEYFNFEDSLGNDLRSYSIIEISIFESEFLNHTDKILLINSVVDKLVENYNFKLARRLYEYMIELSGLNTNYIINRCLFELKVPSEEQIKSYENENNTDDELALIIDDSMKDNVRAQYERFLKKMKESNEVQKRIMILESLKKFEEKYGDSVKVQAVSARLPQIVRKVRNVDDNTKEEYIEYMFPEDEKEIEEQVNEFKADFLNDFAGDDAEESDVDEESEEDAVEEGAKGEEYKGEDEYGGGALMTKSFRSRFASDSEDEAEDEDEKDDGDNNKSFKNRFEE